MGWLSQLPHRKELQQPDYEYDDIILDRRTYNIGLFGSRPQMYYFIRLQNCYKLALQEIHRLTDIINRSENSYIVKRAQKWYDEYNKVMIENGKLNGDIAKYQTEISYYKNKVEQYQKKEQSLQEEINKLKTDLSTLTIQRETKSITDNSKSEDRKQKEKTALRLSLQKVSNKKIADELGIKESTVYNYLSSARKHCTIISLNEGKSLSWDEEYGNEIEEVITTS